MEKTILYQDKRIYYRVSGSGHPVLLVHGFGEEGDVWRNQVEFLKERFRLIVPDLPGSGHSETIDDMSMEGMAEVIRTILDRESPLGEDSEGAKVSLIGHSMGGYITLAFVEKYPDRLNSFGLFHSTAYADSEERKEIRRKGIAFIRQHGAFEFLKTTSPNLFSQVTKEKNPEMVAEFIRGLHNFSAPALVSYYTAMVERPDRVRLLPKNPLPVLFVMGKHDTAVLPGDSLEQSHLPEKSYIYLLHHSAHMGMLEEEGETNQILDKFLLETRINRP